MTTTHPRLRAYAEQLANELQRKWESRTRARFQRLHDSATDPCTKRNYAMHLNYQAQGKFNYGRNYTVAEIEDRYRIEYTCEVSGMPLIHCVVSKSTGDVARHCIKLVEEPFFNYNLLDPRSRRDCLAVCDPDRSYLK